MSEKIIGVVLAGGLARRLGNIDKAFVQIGGISLIDRALSNLDQQCDQTIINANGDPKRFGKINTPIIPDTIQGHSGPLAGVLSAMQWAKQNHPQTKWIASLPVDTPFAPTNFVQRLIQETRTQASEIACAVSNGRHHPVVGLWPVSLATQLHDAMVNENMRKVDLWTARYKLSTIDFPVGQYDPFFNINRPADIKKAEQIIKEQSNAS